MTAKILVVEDEMIIAADISMMLTQLGHEVTGITPRGEDALKSVEATRPDLVLMDISLKGALDGVETACYIHDHFKIPIIFLTANSDEGTFQRAKAAKPYAFITKPFRQSDVQRAIELALERRAEETARAGEAAPGGDEADSFILGDRIFVRHKDKMVKVMLADLLFAEADRNYCILHTHDTKYLMTLPLGSFEEKLYSKDFLRIHRSHIINVTKIDAISDNYGEVTIGQKTLPVGRSFQAALMTRLKVI